MLDWISNFDYLLMLVGFAGIVSGGAIGYVFGRFRSNRRFWLELEDLERAKESPIMPQSSFDFHRLQFQSNQIHALAQSILEDVKKAEHSFSRNGLGAGRLDHIGTYAGFDARRAILIRRN